MLLNVGWPVILVPPLSLFWAMLYMIWKGGRPKLLLDVVSSERLDGTYQSIQGQHGR